MSMSRQTRDEETWQLAGMRAGMKAVDAGLQLEDAPAETVRRARNHVRRLKGVTPAEKAKRAMDYAYWFLDTYLDNLYWVVWDEAPGCETPEGATREEEEAILAADPYCMGWNARMDAIDRARSEMNAAHSTDREAGVASWCLSRLA